MRELKVVMGKEGGEIIVGCRLFRFEDGVFVVGSFVRAYDCVNCI